MTWSQLVGSRKVGARHCCLLLPLPWRRNPTVPSRDCQSYHDLALIGSQLPRRTGRRSLPYLYNLPWTRHPAKKKSKKRVSWFCLCVEHGGTGEGRGDFPLEAPSFNVLNRSYHCTNSLCIYIFDGDMTTKGIKTPPYIYEQQDHTLVRHTVTSSVIKIVAIVHATLSSGGRAELPKYCTTFSQNTATASLRGEKSSV